MENDFKCMFMRSSGRMSVTSSVVTLMRRNALKAREIAPDLRD